ncbi:MAG: hypothetical protein DRI98_14550, partial [Bacteroidetes bacterium]
MKLLAFLETIKLREGFTDAAIQTAVPTAIETLRSDMMSGNDSGVAVELFRLHEYGDPHAEPDDNYEDMEYKYHEWLAEWCEARVYNAADDIMSGMQHNSHAHMEGIVIYRVITATEDFPSNITARGLGEYWSWEEGAAEAHWGGGSDQIMIDGEIKKMVEWLIVGLVDPKHVDWEHSLFQNAHPSFDHEKELYIPEGSPIELYKLVKGNGDEVDPQKYGGRQMLQAGIGEAVIKLRGFGPDSGGANHVAEFMADYEAGTTPNPLDDKARLYGNVKISLSPMSGGVRLSDINAAGARVGDGSKALKFLISLADKHDINIMGTAQAYSASPDEKEQESDRLLRWYHKHGVGNADNSGDEGYEMVYTPRGITESNLAHDARDSVLSGVADDETLFRCGACALMAWALHKELGWDIVGVVTRWDGSGRPTDLVHLWVEKGDKAIDVMGMTDASKMREHWLEESMHFGNDDSELHQFSPLEVKPFLTDERWGSRYGNPAAVLSRAHNVAQRIKSGMVGESNIASSARFARLSMLREARDRLSMADAISIVREIETGRGGIAELMEKKPALKEMSQAKLRGEYGDVVPLFRVISVPEGKEIRDEGIVSTSTDWNVAFHMGRNHAGVVMTRDSFLTMRTVLLRYDTPVEQCLADVGMLLEMVLESLGGHEKIGGQRIKGRRSGEGIEVSHVIQEGMKEDEVIADVSGIEPVVLDFDRKKELDMVRGMGAGEFDSPDEYMQQRDATKGTNEFFPPDEQEQIKSMYARRAPDVKRFLGMNEELYHSTEHDVDKFRPLSHFGTADAAAERAKDIAKFPTTVDGAPRTYKANMPLSNPVKMRDDGGEHVYAMQVGRGILKYYKRNPYDKPAFDLHEFKSMLHRWSSDGIRQHNEDQRV